MAIAIIENWLKSPDKIYAVGLALLERYGTNEVLKIVLRNGSSPYHHGRLVEALEELNLTLAPEAPAAAPLIPVLDPIAHAIHRHSLSDPAWEKAPDAIKDLYVENSMRKSRAELLHHQIAMNPNEGERLDMALQLLDDREATNENWKTIKDFHDTGVAVEKKMIEKKKPVAELTLSELLQEEKNLPPNVSKDKKKLTAGMADGPKKNKVMVRLQANEIRLQQVKKRLADEFVQ